MSDCTVTKFVGLDVHKTAMWELARTQSTHARYGRSPAPPDRRVLQMSFLTTVLIRSHLCLMLDHVSPYWYIRGVTPHSLIRRW